MKRSVAVQMREGTALRPTLSVLLEKHHGGVNALGFYGQLHRFVPADRAPRLQHMTDAGGDRSGAKPSTPPRRHWGREVVADGVRDALKELVKKGTLVALAATVALAAAGAYELQTGRLPAWALPMGTAIGFVLGALAFSVRRRRALRRLHIENLRLIERGRELDRVTDLFFTLEKDADELQTQRELLASYTEHVAQMLNRLQAVVAGRLSVSLTDFVDRGVVQPARDLMKSHMVKRSGTSDVDLRVAILVESAGVFTMRFGAGQTLEYIAAFQMSVDRSKSSAAIRDQEVKVWQDLENEDDYRTSPAPEGAQRSRAMISVPIRSGDAVRATLNMLATRPDVFRDADVQYARLLGSVISVASTMSTEVLSAPSR
jgi:hypothetical protein